MEKVGLLQGEKISIASCKKELLSLIVLWSLAVLFVNPSGNFPLNDDWSYGITVKRLLQEAYFRPLGWTSMPLISHASWGALFSLLFGFSFTTLRLSVLFLGLVAGVATFILLIKFSVNRWIALATSLTILFNPIFFPLSFTFMTDIPFAAWMVLSYFCFISFLQHKKRLCYWGGTLFSLTAILDRQVGLFIPLAFFLTVLFYEKFSIRRLFLAVFPLFLGVTFYLGFQALLKQTGNIPILFDYQEKELANLLHSPGLVITVVRNVFVAILYLGFFFFPLLAIQWRTLIDKDRKRNTSYKIIFLLFIVTGLFLVYTRREFMPIRGNILTRLGVGPVALYDVYTLKIHHFDIPFVITLFFTLISIVGGGLVVVQGFSFVMKTIENVRKREPETMSMVKAFLIFGFVIYVTPILIHSFFDRYLIPAFILLFLYTALSSVRKRYTWIEKGLVFFSLALISLYSLLTTADYLNWNRARWQALDELTTEMKVPPAKIDGGFEFNGWYLYDEHYQRKPSKSWWWVDDDLYIVTMGEIPGTTVLDKIQFHRWLPPKQGAIFILKRKEPTDIPSASH